MLVIALPCGVRVAQFALREPNLPDDLGGTQIAVEALLSRGAKTAVHRAADLTRNAQRAAVGLGYIDRLDALDLVHAQQPLARAVRGGLLLDDLRDGDFRRVGELRAKLLGEVGHFGEIRGAAAVDPLHQLTGAERLRGERLRDERLELGARHAE